VHAATDGITKYCGHQSLEHCKSIAVPYPQSPIHITWLSNVPVMVTNAFFFTSSTRMCTCLYASIRSIFEQYFAQAMSSWITSWSGKGIMSFTILSFCCHASTMVLGLPFFLGMHSSGAACLTEQGSHHPAFTY